MIALDPAARALAAAAARSARHQSIRDRLAASITRVGGRLPAPMAQPPAIVTDPSTTIPGAVSWNPCGDGVPRLHDGLYSFLGARWAQWDASFPACFFFRGLAATYGAPGDAAAASTPTSGHRTRFGFDGDRLEIEQSGHGGGFRLLVDGEHAQVGALTTPPDGNGHRHLVTFADARARTIELEWTGGNGFAGVRSAAEFPPVPAPPADGLRVVVNSDSFGDTISAEPGQAAAAANGSLGANIGRLLGQLDCWNASVGGSGFLNPANNGGNSFGQRVERDVLAPRPDVVFELGGLNDNGDLATDAAKRDALAAAVEDWLARVTTALPDALVVMTGPMSPNGDHGDDLVVVRDIKRAAAARHDRRVVFLDTLGDGPDRGWVTGRRGVRAGTAGRVTGPDTTHPSSAGAEVLARRVVAETAAALARS